MLRNLSQLEVKIGEKLYHFSCDIDSPLTDVKNALFVFNKYLGQIEDQIAAQEAAKISSENISSKDEDKE